MLQSKHILRFALSGLGGLGGLSACDVTGDGIPEGLTTAPGADDALRYRSLENHPGCSVEGLAYAPAVIPGYRCAAKEYASADDPSLPIVVLVHGNSDSPANFERFGDGIDQLAERLSAAGARTYAVDFRVDLVDDPAGNNDTENAARNIDHGWATPILQSMLKAIMLAEPDREIAVIGFSLGATVIRDSYRRLHLDPEVNPWPQTRELILLAGANHGVSSCALCGANTTMRGQVACEMGCRDNFSTTPFLSALNGPEGEWETPCLQDDGAYGQVGICESAELRYTTVVMKDIDDGTYQDQFVSVNSAALRGADNQLIELSDVDESGYFFNGLFKNHYGSARSKKAIDLVVDRVRGER